MLEHEQLVFPTIAPALNVSHDILDFKDKDTSLTFSINNAGIETLIWEIISDKQWISVSPASGTTNEETDNIIVTINRNELTHGTYSGNISIITNEKNKSIKILISIPNHIPVITSSPVIAGKAGGEYNYDVEAMDLDDDILTYSLINAPDNMIIDTNTGVITWKPINDGIYDISVLIDDNYGGIVHHDFVLTIAPIQINTLILLEDFSDMVTEMDGGFNDFSGNMGIINKDGIPFGKSDIKSREENLYKMEFNWDFTISNDQEVFTGIFMSLFGLTDTYETFDGNTIERIYFPEHNIDFDNIDGHLNEPGGPRGIKDICVELSYHGAEDLMLRMELKDIADGTRYIRFRIVGSSENQKIVWDFRDNGSYSIPNGQKDLNLNKVKQLTFVIERQNVADGINNPDSGTIDFHYIWLGSDSLETQPQTDEVYIDLLERRTYQYFLDWSSKKRASLGIPQDRSIFVDLLTIGGVGFCLPAHIIASEHGWITHADAATQVVNVLRILDNPEAFGNEKIGRIGYQGWFYHFLGVDGCRKLNFDYPATPEDESLNTVELSAIDTGLALVGILAAQSYFDADEPTEMEIRQRAQSIYDRVNWLFLLDPSSNQFYLGWKPEIDENSNHPFKISDGNNGYYSGNISDAHTLDYYTDEAFIVSLLAIGSETYKVPVDVFYGWERKMDKDGLIRTYPGALFTYQFLHAFIDTNNLNLPSCSGEDAINWYENSRNAIWKAIDYAENNPLGFMTYGSDSWGFSACEGPFDKYYAYGASPIAWEDKDRVPEDGTINYYSMISSISFDDDIRQRVLSALYKAWEIGHWHPRFGLPDAYNAEINQAYLIENNKGILTKLYRQSGKWAQRAMFAIDQGPMLLHLENSRSGLIWNLMAQNQNILRAIERIKSEPYPTAPDLILFEGEDGTGDGTIRLRSSASNLKTKWLLDNESCTFLFNLIAPERYSIDIRYSNDNFGPLETVKILIDGSEACQFVAQDTGDYGNGWNIFLSTGPIATLDFQSGTHEITVIPYGGDGYGVEIDLITLQADTN